MGVQTAYLSGGERLHLNHGPIDLIIGANAAARDVAFELAIERFAPLLDELVSELDLLRCQISTARPKGQTARAMWDAVTPHADQFITPMAAVAGAVADTVLEAMAPAPHLAKAYVNNGGDAAFFLAPDQYMTVASPAGPVTICHTDPYRGVASSGWRGRSHSLGIADNVTVVAKNAAGADAAATLTSNAIDLPGHPAVQREAAIDLAPDSDLGARPVTVAVGDLSPKEVDSALQSGARFAGDLLARHLIGGATLSLGGKTRIVGKIQKPEPKQTELLDA